MIMPSPTTESIAARTGKAVTLPKGHTIRVINTYGTQVVDFWAFTLSAAGELSTFLSLPHTRATTLHLIPRVSDILTTNLRAPILELTADTSPGVHDTLIAACDPARYRLLGCDTDHASCATNLRQGLADAGVAWPAGEPLLEHWTPAPFNLFMNIPVDQARDHALSFEPTVSKVGDYVELKALVDDVVVIMSCCPQDKVPINAMEPKGVEYMVISP